MNCEIEVETIVKQTVVLEMSMEEALWLKHAMQNPLYCDDPDQEDPQDKTNRNELFHTLPSFLELKENNYEQTY
jgi:hypothetical protein